jgi:hypothetical protein
VILCACSGRIEGASTALFEERRAYRDPLERAFALGWRRIFGERGTV